MKEGRYYYVQTGSHATAAYCEGDRIRYYDPNVGEVYGITTEVLAKYLKDCKDDTQLATNWSEVRKLQNAAKDPTKSWFAKTKLKAEAKVLSRSADTLKKERVISNITVTAYVPGQRP